LDYDKLFESLNNQSFRRRWIKSATLYLADWASYLANPDVYLRWVSAGLHTWLDPKSVLIVDHVLLCNGPNAFSTWLRFLDQVQVQVQLQVQYQIRFRYQTAAPKACANHFPLATTRFPSSMFDAATFWPTFFGAGAFRTCLLIQLVNRPKFHVQALIQLQLICRRYRSQRHR